MGNCVSLSIPLDQSVNKATQWLEEKVACIHNLEKNLTILETTMIDLKAKQNDLLRKLQREEDRGLERLDIVQVWLTRVYSLETKVNDLLSVKDVQLQRLCLCGFCVKSFSTCGYGKSVFLTLREVEKLKSEDFEVIAEQPLIPMVEERQLQPIIVGQEKMLEQAWKHLMKDEVGIMGMFGMGGVGKTTLLTQIYNKFNKDKSGFDYVIWIVVSQDLNIEKIQDEITQKVGLSRDTSEKGIHLFNFLRRKRFVLFLDDIWEKVDLAEIGVPDPRTQKGCKLVFSTRSQSVCSHMGVEDPMEVQCLGDNEAFDLFEKKVGQVTLGSDIGIPELAKIVAKKCCGLPLALNVIGETMSCKKTTQEWRHAIHVLNSYAAEFSGMEDKILPLLKYSYDNLKGDHLKSCLLYCALFPEDYKIVKEDLIEYWICEGIIDGSEGIEKAENEGYDIVGSLVQSSLLMEGVNRRHYVTMHDVVREMALWIASDLGKQKEAFIVRAGVGLQDIPKVKNWAVVKKMSLMENKINHLVGSRKCLELTTLLLRGLSLQSISSEFFMSMRKLTVLDLSRNERLRELSGISKLVSLQYLNLASTGIYHLPKGLQELIKLIHLDLENTWELKSIDGISRVRNLKVLKLKGSYFTWDLNTVQELEALEHLEILTKEFEDLTSPVRQKILSSHKLMSCEQSLRVIRLCSFGISLPETMDKLQNFEIFGCSISQIKMGRRCSFLSLVEVSVSHVEGLRDLTFLKFAPNLRILNVSCSGEIEDIINTEKALKVDNSWILPFLRLKELILRDLPLLNNIFCSPLPFPCLEMITIKECPNLKKLPLDSKSGKHGDNEIMITCHEEWIKSVEWEDEATKTRFLSSL